MTTKRTYELGGGKYAAVQNDDGSNTWNILDVPICGEVPKDAKGNDKTIDRAWLEGAVKKHQFRFQNENFKPPLHYKHHGVAVQTERAGEFIPHRVGKLQYNGKPTDVVFADLIRVPDHIFQRIEKGELPYLSVELGSWEDGEFASLAIMDDDRPYFAFPNLTIGDKEYATAITAQRIVEPAGMAQAFAFADTGSRVLCKFGGGIKLNDDGSEKKDDEDKTDRADRAESGAGENSKTFKSSAEAEEKPADPAQSNDMLTLLKQIITTLNLLAKNQTGVGGETAEPKDENKAPVDQEPPMDESKKKPAASAETEIQLSARVAGLETKIELREKQDAVKALAAKGEADLKGWHLTDSVKAALLKAAEKGEDMLKLFVDTYKSTVPKDPPATFGAFESAVGAPSNDPEVDKVLLAYQARSPETLEHARHFVRLYGEAKRAGLTRLSVESFVAAQFRGLEARAQVNGAAR